MKYFMPIDLPEQPEELKPTDLTIPNWPSKERWEPIINRISTELNNIQQGISTLAAYAISLGKDNAPLMATWARFKEQPTKEHLDEFLNIVENTISLRAKIQFKEWVTLILERKL